ncbi:hypothetical protein ONZ51_g11634 [Trametes cubensis]|uniref:Uncharacterized protein n=1 Tax=Trametes cubensis TaxID=1111947 RepID=A0AAD7THL6_9APHY|nr:hypothetical protein ONZ51_g11634 [Trametes cubensis]
MVHTHTRLTGRCFSEASRCNIPCPPNFIREQQMVFYNHLPGHTVSCNDKGTLAVCIGWVTVHSDLYSHVEAQNSHLPEVKDLINVYHILARAAPLYSVLIKHNQRMSAPKSEKKKVDQVANEAYQAVIQAAEKVLLMLANPQITGALLDLMPLCNQHSTHSWGHAFWLQHLNNYPQAIEVNSLDEEEDKDEVSTPDPGEKAIKWDLTSAEGLTLTLSSPSSDSSYSEVESFDLLPKLDHLELSTINELSEDKFHEALKVAVRAPSPPPPPLTAITKHVEEPHVTQIMDAYHLRWPEASIRTTQAASLLINNVIAQRGCLSAFKVDA